MSFGAIVKNAGSHRILYALLKNRLTSKELRNIVGAINGVARFEGEYLARLSSYGYVERADDDTWKLTDQGRMKVHELGPVDEKPVKREPAGLNWKERPPYDPKSDLHTYIRPGSDDAMKLPSRIGNKLYYRDGTVKEI